MRIHFAHSLPLIGALALSFGAFAAEPAWLTAPAPAHIDAPANSVMLHFAGAERLSIDGSGGLEILSADGGVRRYRPDLYQVVNGKHKIVRYRYHIIDNSRVELQAIGADASAPLRVAPQRGIDPNA